MRLYIQSEVPLRLSVILQCWRQLRSHTHEQKPPTAWGVRVLEKAESYRLQIGETVWNEEKKALLELAAELQEHEWEIVTHPVVLPTGIHTSLLPLLEGITIGRWTDGAAGSAVSPFALLWLKEMKARYTDKPGGHVNRAAACEGIALLQLESKRAVPICWEEREHREEHIDEGMLLLQANLDDTSPEWMAYAMQRLLQAGANDVAFVPMTMKKNRPGAMIQVLCYRSDVEGLKSILFAETTTFGIRYFPVAVHRLARTFVTVNTKWGEVEVKLGFHQGKRVQVSPEYEACARLAAAAKVPLSLVYTEARRLASRNIDSHQE